MDVSHFGLVVKPLLPYLGVTPDGIMHCTCCGKGFVEPNVHLSLDQCPSEKCVMPKIFPVLQL